MYLTTYTNGRLATWVADRHEKKILQSRIVVGSVPLLLKIYTFRSEGIENRTLVVEQATSFATRKKYEGEPTLPS